MAGAHQPASSRRRSCRTSRTSRSSLARRMPRRPPCRGGQRPMREPCRAACPGRPGRRRRDDDDGHPHRLCLRDDLVDRRLAGHADRAGPRPRQARAADVAGGTAGRCRARQPGRQMAAGQPPKEGELMVRHGFTLIELLVVIAIMAIMMACLMPAFTTANDRARVTECRAHLTAVGLATDQYRRDRGGMPGGLRDLYTAGYVTDDSLLVCTKTGGSGTTTTRGRRAMLTSCWPAVIPAPRRASARTRCTARSSPCSAAANGGGRGGRGGARSPEPRAWTVRPTLLSGLAAGRPHAHLTPPAPSPFRRRGVGWWVPSPGRWRQLCPAPPPGHAPTLPHLEHLHVLSRISILNAPPGTAAASRGESVTVTARREPRRFASSVTVAVRARRRRCRR